MKEKEGVTITLPREMVNKIKDVADERMISKSKIIHLCLTTKTTIDDLSEVVVPK